jgi:hypothetical protein
VGLHLQWVMGRSGSNTWVGADKNDKLDNVEVC